MQASLLQELGIVDCAVFKQDIAAQFSLCHSNDTWLESLFPMAKTNKTIDLAQGPAYLADFLYEANEFWQLGVDGRINSGVWSEQTDHGLWRLEAAAIKNGPDNYLVLFNIENEYNKRQRMLQAARELLISNDKILEQHDQLRERVEALASNAHGLDSTQLPMRQAIENADFGVAILDAKMQILEQNPALYRLFQLTLTDNQQPAKILLNLCHRQFPEFQRVLETKSRWNAELYWIKPGEVGRWLQITICPITDKQTGKNFWLSLATDVSREKYLQQNNERLIYFDVQTNLPNRRNLWQSLDQAIEQTQEFYFLQFTIKGLKRINEVYGHKIGDEVLKALVDRLQPMLQSKDLLARIGGNEFAVILHSKHQPCHELAEQLIATANEPFYILDKYKCQVGLSIGVARYPADGLCTEDILKYADLAAYTAKRKQKSSVQFYSAELKERSRKRLELEAALRDAIEEEQFELYLQPILNLETGAIRKAEVLIRWQRPEVGIVPPDQFIPIAEQTGLISPIGRWVISKATELLAKLQQQNYDITLSVNLSPSQISDRNLLEFIQQNISHSQIEPNSLELELTEGVLVNDFDKVQHFLQEARKSGMSIAIDDFGTGYSSLSYLQKLPIDHLKIDRSFICDLDTNDSNKAIVLAVLAMARSLEMGVIAEGVENKKQRQFLFENNCQTAQGYLFSKPVPFAEFCQLLKD